MLSTLSHSYCPFVYFIWRNVYSELLPILKLVYWLFILSCESSFYIPDSSLLSNIWFENIFSHSMGCLFTSLMVSFKSKYLFSIMSNLFSSCSHASGIKSSCIVAVLTFRLTIHFKIIFYMAWSRNTNLILFLCIYSYLNIICWKDFFPHWIVLIDWFWG